jgi:ubiquinone/menaquinone biosynthesis C-methylase UbiE
MPSSVRFYDAIAENYDSQMTESDARVRAHIANIFNSRIPCGNVLDFGGGTGLDLPWLICDKYKIYFLEPSSNMRSIAKASLPENGQGPIFVEEMTDFHNWSKNNLPFDEKMNGILANFAVLNCVPDIDSLFEKLSFACADNCCMLATVLDTRPLRIMKIHSLKVAIKILLNKQLTTLNKYKDITQETYLHTVGKYKSAARKYFNFVSYTSIRSSHFALLILSKK